MRSEGPREAWPAVTRAIATPAFGLGEIDRDKAGSARRGLFAGARQGTYSGKHGWVCEGGAGAVENPSEHFFLLTHSFTWVQDLLNPLAPFCQPAGRRGWWSSKSTARFSGEIQTFQGATMRPVHLVQFSCTSVTS